MIEILRSTFKYRFVVENHVYSSLKQKYRRSIFGFFWSVLAPLLQNLIVGLVFYHLMRFDMPNYLVYLFSGTVIFNLMSTVIVQSPGILVNNEHFIKKVYVPKLVFVLQVVFMEVVNTCLVIISLLLLGGLFGQISFSFFNLFLIFPIFLTIVMLTGLATALAVLSVYFRDLFHIVPVVMQAALFLTPVIYPMSIVPEGLMMVIKLNPFYYFVDLFREIILFNRMPSLESWLICLLLSALAFWFGLKTLAKHQNTIVFKL